MKFLFVFAFAALFGQCPFCPGEVVQRQKFYEDEFVIAMCTHKPMMEGHCLVIPKRHVERFEDLTAEESMHIFLALQKVDASVKEIYGTSASLLLQKNGKEVGQSVFHVHFHYIPRVKGDDSVVGFLYKMFSSDWFGPIASDNLCKNVEAMRETMAKKSSDAIVQSR